MTQYRRPFEAAEEKAAEEKAAAKQEADEKKIADAKEKKDADAAAKKEEAKDAKDDDKAEKKDAPKRRSLAAQLEEVIVKLEEHEERFDQKDQLAFQGLGKRLSRTLGAYRAPKE